MIIWNNLNTQQQRQVLARPTFENEVSLEDRVNVIVSKVRLEGDRALFELVKKFDDIELEQLYLTEDRKADILATLSQERKKAIDLAYQNITSFHRAQAPLDVKVETSPGVNCQLLNRAIQSVGLYIPGGSAPLPSTVLMLGVPAQIAKCDNIIMCTPPCLDKDNQIGVTPEILYAATLCGIDNIYLSGGAQAIAAMAYGTESIPKVDKIFGPGNRFVTQAKQMVSLDRDGAAIDMPAGPSELLVIADSSAEPKFVAADLLSQAEHGADSQVILLCDDAKTLAKVEVEVEQQLTKLSREAIARSALEQSRFILTHTIQESIEISNRYAPEHLILQTKEPEQLLPNIRNAASIFVGPYTPESAGDYASGTNHVLPTYGYARVLSSLSLADFIRRFTVQTISAQGLKEIGPAIMTLAEAEQLEGHKNAVKIRLEQIQEDMNNE